MNIEKRFNRLKLIRNFFSVIYAAVAIIAAPNLLPAAERENTLLESGWRFIQSEAAGAEQSDFDDGSWRSVSLPHNWGWENAQQGKDFYRGPGWYRRELNIGAPQPGKRYFLRFQAASQVANVYLNGKMLGEHRGAFGAFCFEITKAMSATGKNLLAVRVSNAKEPDVAPLAGDFSVYGGLYRPVHVIATGEEIFSLTDHGSPGVAWMQTNVSSTQASLDVIAQISNGTRRKVPMQFIAKILDADGKVAAEESRKFDLTASVTEPHALRVTLANPHLWDGRKDPYLYRAVTELRSADGNIIDSVEQPLGLRFFSVDPDKGFFLNGRPYHLHGVNRHQDRIDKGWATSEADQDEDMRLVSELGCTVIRCAHYQHSDYFYGLCDKAGILVWAEIPQVNEIGPVPRFEETSRNQLVDLIRQSINHPSIFAWSLFNEVNNNKSDPHRELQDLLITAKGEDPTRPVIAATCIRQLPQMNKIPDLLGWNIYPGWYPGWPPLSEYGQILDGFRTTSRSGGYCLSEYGAGANPAQHEQNAKQPTPGGQWHPEEWQSTLHETAWAALKERPFVWGSFVWCMFDFAVSSRNEGGIPGLNDKGLVTRDRKTKKDAFYFYKANWSDEPVLYITSRRFTERTNPVTDVKIYSNAPEVELLVNGSSQGKRGDAVNGILIWKDVKLSPGENKIDARAIRNGQPIVDHCTWTLKPKQ